MTIVLFLIFVSVAVLIYAIAIEIFRPKVLPGKKGPAYFWKQSRFFG